MSSFEEKDYKIFELFEKQWAVVTAGNMAVSYTHLDVYKRQGRSEIERCSAKTVRQLAKALDCTMEDIMELSSPYDSATGLPKDKSYLERGLPPFLMESIAAMKAAWKKLDGGEPYLRWDCDYCNLQTDINNAEVNQIINPEQAWYLREKYLRLERA